MRKSIRKQDFKFEYRKNIPVIVKGRHTLKLYITRRRQCLKSMYGSRETTSRAINSSIIPT